MRRDQVDPEDWLRQRIEEISAWATQTLAVHDEYEEDYGTRIEIRVWTDDREIVLQGYLDDLELHRDMIDATAYGDIEQTYLVGERTFRLSGRQAVWKKKEQRDDGPVRRTAPDQFRSARGRRWFPGRPSARADRS